MSRNIRLSVDTCVMNRHCSTANRLFGWRPLGDQQVDRVWNVMAHAQKPDFVFRRNGRVRLNRRGRQFSRLLAGELCTSACRVCTARASSVLQSCDAYWLPTPISCFPFTSPPVRHRVPSHINRTLIQHYLWFPLHRIRKQNEKSAYSTCVCLMCIGTCSGNGHSFP
jgi:hypothetical protein